MIFFYIKKRTEIINQHFSSQFLEYLGCITLICTWTWMIAWRRWKALIQVWWSNRNSKGSVQLLFSAVLEQCLASKMCIYLDRKLLVFQLCIGKFVSFLASHKINQSGSAKYSSGPNKHVHTLIYQNKKNTSAHIHTFFHLIRFDYRDRF